MCLPVILVSKCENDKPSCLIVYCPEFRVGFVLHCMGVYKFSEMTDEHVKWFVLQQRIKFNKFNNIDVITMLRVMWIIHLFASFNNDDWTTSVLLFYKGCVPFFHDPENIQSCILISLFRKGHRSSFVLRLSSNHLNFI